ncbi:hypothetical protein [Paractinoplanes rishiriensis]|uniref:Uncharacterized protein n=1 Tax=Paractinoplanes rishiriensis TaxID=1050105 RepID=A0A919K1E5_9ACTN|nr:hypothetical protein [Actinoplanes rishiriensis]GIE99121.1 hypothetical protein Ari01nite_65860 [Actinoplanes rishiriensis]
MERIGRSVGIVRGWDSEGGHRETRVLQLWNGWPAVKVTRIAYSHRINTGKYAKLVEQAARLGRVRSEVWQRYDLKADRWASGVVLETGFTAPRAGWCGRPT